jgi:alkyldihydroxyacetonephosphate synthase
VKPPENLREIVTDDPRERARHTYGRSFRDIVRAFRRDYSAPPDQVAFPREERDVVALLDWCGANEIAAIPFGGGSSVVGGVESAVAPGFRGVVSIDLTRLGRVLEVDRVSRAAKIQGAPAAPASARAPTDTTSFDRSRDLSRSTSCRTVIDPACC